MTSRVRRTTNDIAISALNLLIAGVCLYAIASMTWTWSATRSWQPVQAQLVNAEMFPRRGKRRVIYVPTAAYLYAVGGVSYAGKKISLGWFPGVTEWEEERTIKNLRKGQPLTVWVNPRQPGKSVIGRTFDTCAALCWFLVGQLTLCLAYRYGRPDRRLAPGPTIPPEPAYRTSYLLAVSWNLMLLPLLAIGVLEGRFLPLLLMLPVALTGILIAWITWLLHRRRWQLGPPSFVDVSDGPSTTTARFIFSPRYGTRLAGEQVSPQASLAFRQVGVRTRIGKETLETIAEGPLGTVRLEFGSRSLDFTGRLPDWPVSAGLRPAYLELELNIGAVCLIYRVTDGLPH